LSTQRTTRPLSFISATNFGVSSKPALLFLLATALRALSTKRAVEAFTISLLLLSPQPPTDWQRLLGINLSYGLFRAENEQAAALLRTLQGEGTQSASVYSLELSSPARAFEAGLRGIFSNP
jgi:hypothetical protein